MSENRLYTRFQTDVNLRIDLNFVFRLSLCLNKSNYNKLREYLDLNWDSELKQCTGDVEMILKCLAHRMHFMLCYVMLCYVMLK